jgi:hypothetical protein
MRKLTATLCLTLAVLLGSMGVSWSADYQRSLISVQSEDYATALLEWEFLKKQVNKNFQILDTSKLYSPTSVLFLGNSLTYYNFSIPDTLSELIKTSQIRFTAKISQKSKGGYGLHDHYRYSFPLNDNQDWEIIIVQGHSKETLTGHGKDFFFSSARLLKKKITNAGARMVLFMTWAYWDDDSMIDEIKNSYLKIGHELGIQVVPVGLAFSSVSEKYSHIDLYSDERHPSNEGTYLAACVFFAALFRRTPEGSDFFGSIEPDQAQILQRSAWSTVRKFYSW